MTLKRIQIIAFLFSLTLCHGVRAADVTLTINGKVVAKPCSVVTKDISINLGNLYTFSFISPGASSEWKDFVLSLNNCPVGTTSVKATFNGDSDATGLYRNKGTANNIQLQLREKNGASLNSGSIKALRVNASTSDVSFPLQVRAISINGGATQGTINSIIYVTYTYI
ncbi:MULTISPECIES: fimbrial protein [Klebsiella]|uniref:fimbrial protein n=1 Tax=Klebsiella TaxID=570 RepID=UPI00115A98C2|nr:MULTISPECIES: fimbrial protein [Klebsiella]NNS04956.1 type 1 fimbrial protein [Klebsiella michiganensis]